MAQPILHFTDNGVIVYQHYISIKEKLPISSLAHRLIYEFITEEVQSLKELQSIFVEISINKLIKKLTDVLSELNYRLHLDIGLVMLEETNERYLKKLYQFVRKIKRTQSDTRDYQLSFSCGVSVEPVIYLADIIFMFSLFQPIVLEFNDRNTTSVTSHPKLSMRLSEQAIREGLFSCYSLELPEMLAFGAKERASDMRRLAIDFLMRLVQMISQHHGQRGVSPLFLADTIVSFSLYLYHSNITELSEGDERRQDSLLRVQKALNPSYLPYPFDSLLREMRVRKQVTFSPERHWVYVPPYEIWSKADLIKNGVYFPNGIRLVEILPQLDKSLENEQYDQQMKGSDYNSMDLLFTNLLDQLEQMSTMDRTTLSQASVPESSVAGTQVSTEMYQSHPKTNQLSRTQGNLTQLSVATISKGATNMQTMGSTKIEDRPSYKLIIKPLLDSREFSRCNISLPTGVDVFIFARVPALSYTTKILEEGTERRRERRAVFGKLTKAMRSFIFKLRKEIFPIAVPELDRMQTDLRQLLKIDATTQQTKIRFSQTRQAKEWENTHITDEWYIKCKEDRITQ